MLLHFVHLLAGAGEQAAFLAVGVRAGRDFGRLPRAGLALNCSAFARGRSCTIGAMGREGLAPLMIAALVAPATGCSLLVDTDIGVRSDGGTGGQPDAGSSAVCGTVGRLQDDFSDDQLSPRWEEYRIGAHIGVATPVSDRLRMSFVGGVEDAAGEISQVESQFAYDLVGEAVSVRVEQVDDKWRSNLVIRKSVIDAPSAGIGTIGTDVTAWIHRPPDGIDVLASTPFVGSLHRTWRIRESAGGLAFETIGDDGEPALLADLRDPGFALDNLFVALRVESGEASTAEGFVELDDVNQGAVARPACPIADLADPFTTPAPALLWLDRSSGCTVETGDGRLVASAEGTKNCQLASAKAYSIEDGGALLVEVSRFPSAGSAVSLHLTDAGNHLVFFRQLDGVLHLELSDGTVTVQDWETANDVDAQWWRVTERDGDLVMETSEDGTDFTPVHTFEPGGLIDLAEVRAVLTLQAGGEPASADFGGVNQEP
jgi:hypothetical protein